MHVTDSAALEPSGLHNYRRWVQRGQFLIASLIAVANVAFAGTNTWTSLGPSGGLIYDLAFHPTDPATIYAATSAGFYRSSDAGSSWQHTSADGLGIHFRPMALAVEASQPDRVHISSGHGVALRSEDQGLTLRVTNGFAAQGGGAIAAAADGSAVYYAVEGNVYRSTDGGASRGLRGTLSDFISTLRIDPTNPQIVYATSYLGGVHRSTDGGANWTTIFSSVDASYDGGVWTLTIDPQNANRIWLGTNQHLRVSVDAGATWQSALASSAVDIDVDPRNPQLVYATTSDGRIERTTDGGTNWALMSRPTKADSSGRRRLAIHPADSAHLYVFGSMGIFESTDAGATWVQKDNGIIATSPGRFSPTTTASGHFFFPVMGYGMGGVRPGDEQLEYSFTPAVPGTHEVTAVLSLPTRLIASFSDSRTAISSNLGATWASSIGDIPAPVSSLVAAVNGGSTVYAATGEGVYRSDDYGNHWMLSFNGLPADADAGPIAAAADQTSLYAAIAVGTTGNSTIYRSLDGGQSWSLTPTVLEKRSVTILAPHPTDAQTLLVGTNEGAFKTTDGGSTWQMMELHPGVTDAPVSAMAFDPTNPNIIYFDQPANVGNMHRSVDGGSTFQKITPDYYDGAGAISLAMWPDHPYRVLAAVPGGGVREISIMPDLQVGVSTQSSSAAPNSPVEFTITASNRGPFDATGVQVDARLPTAVSGTAATGNGSTCTVTNGFVSCGIDILRNQQAMEIRLTTTPTAAGSLTAMINVRAAQPDSATANNSASATVLVSAPPPSNSGGGGGGGTFDITAIIGLLSLSLLRRRRRFV